MKRLKSAALLLPLLALSACTHHLSSAERHAKHYVYQTRDDFDPQFRT
ncbi:Exc2 family lipoprotein, partial [Serratia marcescens]